MSDEQLKLAAAIFADLPDQRHHRGLNHSLVNIVVMALCAVMSGADTFPEIQTFVQSKREWFLRFLDFRRVPDHETFRRVLSKLDPTAFQSSALDWVKQAVGGKLEGDIISIDGKRLRGTSAHEVQGIHMVNVWAARQGLCLSAQAVKGKQNELSTLPSVLDTLAYLDVAGCIVTIDAMGTQRTVARKLVALQAQYVLALKGNQDTLFEDVQEMFDDASRRLFADTALLGVSTWDDRRRDERRTCWVLPASPDLDDHEWPGLQSVALIESSRLVKGKRVSQRRLFLCSFAPDPLTALHAVRTHWQVENSLHWVLDVAFAEDANVTVADHGAENLAVLRRWALNLMRQEGSVGAINKNRKRAGWDDLYRDGLLQQLRPDPT
ncbi:ISAs1 family transposase [Deinococcus aquaticus]|uniref:ISAs1 family transposase n=1 Tax=Deinococcus aquaticus TaxID=328692 RepID=A0ABY7UZE2_9DEIO|nr:ISAs1 family transposase [Deinococcus aquaticus]WDA57890.1 ISAs1 family transposase [Deinococcus aquaticus]WDA58637.1 ISAs1 family transposase [Deinococcus aquaticus]